MRTRVIVPRLSLGWFVTFHSDRLRGLTLPSPWVMMMVMSSWAWSWLLIISGVWLNSFALSIAYMMIFILHGFLVVVTMPSWPWLPSIFFKYVLISAIFKYWLWGIALPASWVMMVMSMLSWSRPRDSSIFFCLNMACVRIIHVRLFRELISVSTLLIIMSPQCLIVDI